MAAPEAREAWSFLDPVLVDCPRCGACAGVRAMQAPPEAETSPERYRRLMYGPRRLSCLACGLTRDQGPIEHGRFAAPTMGLALRLRAETGRGDLRFYNLEHLAYVRAFIADPLRAEAVSPDGPRNRSVFSRLPAWAKRAHARDGVLKAIDKAAARAKGCA